MEDRPRAGRISIATEVLETIARLTTLAVPGVARLVSEPGMRRLLGRNGVKIDVAENSVHVELHLITDPGVNMLKIGRQVQAEVARAIRDLVGMEAKSVDVYIEDVVWTSVAK
jgi:uncharacterized alkaline shock family protein YloU